MSTSKEHLVELAGPNSDYKKFVEGVSNISANKFTESGDVGGTIATSQMISVGEGVFGELASGTDVDMYSFTATDGEYYQINLAGNTSTANPLYDTTLTLYDAAGVEIEFNDDFIGLSSQITFLASSSGPYYALVDGFDSTETGFYEMSVAQIPPPPPTTPLDALNWASYTAPTTIDVYFATAGLNVIDAVSDFGSFTSTAWSASERAAAIEAFELFESITNLQFNYVNNIGLADFVMFESANATNSLGYWDVGMEENGGSISVNGVNRPLEGFGVFNNGEPSWDAGGLEQGGYSFVTLIHEIGHGLGLAHPHDNGGGSTFMNGVSSPYDDFGDFNLNQGIYTMMSYNDGWVLEPHSTDVTQTGDFGFQATPMALDIAQLQAMYGANTTTNSGANFYVLPTSNGPGTFYESIWDAGGADVITAGNTNRDVTIDLRAATLDYSTTGGGLLSYAEDIHGGFTIANGVVIENAFGGAGDDTLTGNDSANYLRGNDGNDSLNGGGGVDHLRGGEGSDDLRGGNGGDLLYGQNGDDNLYGNIGEDRLVGGLGDDRLRGGNDDDSLASGGGEDILFGDSGHDDLFGGAANDRLNGGEGNDVLRGESGLDILRGDAGNDDLFGGTGSDDLFGGTGMDRLFGFQGMDELFGEAGDDILEGGDNMDTLDGGADNDVLRGQSGNDTLLGQSGNDTLNGGANNDRIDGGIGTDLMTGGTGNDTFVYASGYENDSINDFDDVGNDRIDISSFGFNNYATQVEGLMNQVGAHVDIDFGGGDVLRLRNTDIADMGSDDFILA